jgi:hypothetical protein
MGSHGVLEEPVTCLLRVACCVSINRLRPTCKFHALGLCCIVLALVLCRQRAMVQNDPTAFAGTQLCMPAHAAVLQDASLRH